MKKYFKKINRQRLLMIAVLGLAFVFTTTTALASLTFSSTAITGDSSSVIDVGAGNTLSLQTTGNAPITTGAGLLTAGGNLSVTGNASLGQAPATLTTVSDNPMSSGATTLNVPSTTGYPSAGTLLIQSELITYTGTTSTTFTGLTRGAFGTSAASHVSGTTVNISLLLAQGTSSIKPKVIITGNGYVGINAIPVSGQPFYLSQPAGGADPFYTFENLEPTGRTVVYLQNDIGKGSSLVNYGSTNTSTSAGISLANTTQLNTFGSGGGPTMFSMGAPAAATALVFFQGGSERLRIASSRSGSASAGNVGVAVANPNAKFQVQGDTSNGTGTISSSGTAVTGSGTFFTSQLKVGDTIIAGPTAAPNEDSRRVTAITDNTNLTVDLAFTTNLAASTAFNYSSPRFGVTAGGNVNLGTNLAFSTSTPTISSGFGTSPSVTGGTTAAFRVNVGTGGAATSGVIGLPTAATGWNCMATDQTTTSSTVFMTKQTASTLSTVTLGNFNTSGAAAAWTASDILLVNCIAF